MQVTPILFLIQRLVFFVWVGMTASGQQLGTPFLILFFSVDLVIFFLFLVGFLEWGWGGGG